MSKINISYNGRVTEEVQLPLFFYQLENKGVKNNAPIIKIIGVISKVGLLQIYLSKDKKCHGYLIQNREGVKYHEICVKIKRELEGYVEVNESAFMRTFRQMEEIRDIQDFFDVRSR